jgi:murein DD-endopeptidase MepM/ murein hydrolase activator NlpD
MLAGCSGQGVSVGDLQAERYQEHRAASTPIPSEPVYGYNDSETVAAVARYQQPTIERKKLEPVRVASLDNSYVGSSYAMQPVQPASQSNSAGGVRYAQAGPGYYPQSGYGDSRPESYEDGDYEPDYERERVAPRYDAERYLRDDHRAEGYAPDDHGYYTVVAGDTVYSLAKRFGMTMSELAELNGIISSKIFVGQRLRVSGKPVYTASHRYKPAKKERHDYGETSHEDKYDQYEERGGYDQDERKSPPPRARTYSSYEEYNAQKSRPYGEYDRREQGYEEREEETDHYRKSYKKPSGGYEKYTVRRGDTLDAIARYFRVNYRELAQFNDISASDDLHPGQVLRIPRERGEALEYEREESGEEDDYSERRAPARQYKPAENDESVPYWKRRAASRPAAKPEERKVASAETGVSTPEVVMDNGEDQRTSERRPRAPEQEEAPVQDEEPVIAALSDVNAAGSRPKQAQASVGDCNELLENPMPRSAETFREPVQGLIVSRFGAKTDETINDGVDFSVPKGTPVKAAENGVIAYTGDELPGFGKLILVRHADGYVTAYAHNDEVLVNRCDVVKRGQVISHAGTTGKVTKPLLHFEIRKDAKPVDPEAYFTRS